MSEVSRNEQGQILDKNEAPVELGAAYSQAEVNLKTREAERARELASIAMTELGSADPATYEAHADVIKAETERDAAEWKNHKYYRENMQGYEEAAEAEDARRTEEKEKAEQSEQTGEVQK